jgi:hypothetical protein
LQVPSKKQVAIAGVIVGNGMLVVSEAVGRLV